MNNDAYIGIDFGTSGCRAIAIDQQANIIGSSQLALQIPPPTSTISEQDPIVQWQLVVQVLSQLITQCQGFAIKAIAVDATSGSILITDQHGLPITPIVMYNDSRAVSESKKIAQLAPAQSAAHGTSSGLSKLIYLFNNNILQDNHKVLHHADWININLGAPLGITDENNALKTGYDPVEGHWPPWIDSVIDRTILPKVVPPGTTIGQLSAELCQQLSLVSPPNIIAGTTDSVAALLATGANQSGDAVTSLGSTLVVKLISEQAIFIPEQGVYSHRLGDKWLVGGGSNSGGAVLSHYFNNAQLQMLSEQISLNIQPLNYYPLLSAGERFPVNDPELLPRLSPRPKDDVAFLYGMLNGIAKIEQQAYQCLEQAGATPLNSIRTAGGGASNATWQSIRQQHISVPFITPKYTQAAYGVALLAKGHTTATIPKIPQDT